jgi:Ser/Thr protein kinase RdoA (MazF antagonist)
VQAELLAVAQQPLPLGTVLADVWSDHLFFEDHRLVAIIDYGGLRTDTVAADLSRCLSSLCGRDAAARGWALEAYQRHRGLTAVEQVAVQAFDASSQLLGPMHWVRWLFVEQRLPVEPRVRQRVERIVAGQPF